MVLVTDLEDPVSQIRCDGVLKSFEGFVRSVFIKDVGEVFSRDGFLYGETGLEKCFASFFPLLVVSIVYCYKVGISHASYRVVVGFYHFYAWNGGFLIDRFGFFGGIYVDPDLSLFCVAFDKRKPCMPL